jgi:probable HAF family extracellular repeat protein
MFNRAAREVSLVPHEMLAAGCIPVVNDASKPRSVRALELDRFFGPGRICHMWIRVIGASLFVCLMPAFGQSTYTVTDLGLLSPTGVNSWAQVVGNYKGHAFIWARGQRTRDLGLISGGTFSSAAEINDLGVVTGTADGPGTLVSAYPGFPNVDCIDLTQPFIWTARTGMRGLGAPENLPLVFFGFGSEMCDPAASYGRDINNSSQVAGDLPFAPNNFAFALLWTRAAGMTAMGGSWPPTFGNGISNTGELVGQNSDTLGMGYAAIWKNGYTTDLGPLDAGESFYTSSANGINDLGFAVGWATTGPVGLFIPIPVHAMLWTPAREMRDLGTLPGDTSSAALKINFFGQVIGCSGDTLYSFKPEMSPFEVIGRPFIWTERTGMRDLNTLIPHNSGWVLQSVADINVWGQIVGSGTRNGQPHGFLLTPRNPFTFSRNGMPSPKPRELLIRHLSGAVRP